MSITNIVIYRGQDFRSLKANLFSSKRVGLGAKLKFYKSLVLPRLMYGAAELGPHRGTGGTT